MSKSKSKGKVIDFNGRLLEKIQKQMEHVASSDEKSITEKNLSFHIQNVTNLYLQIFSEMTMKNGYFDETAAIKVKQELEKQLCFLFKVIEDQIEEPYDAPTIET